MMQNNRPITQSWYPICCLDLQSLNKVSDDVNATENSILLAAFDQDVDKERVCRVEEEKDVDWKF